MLLIEASKDPALLPRLIRELSQRPLSAVLPEPWVTGPLQPLLERHHELVRLVTARIRLDRGVATYDLADLDVDNVNKFIAYAADASTLYTVSVSRGPNPSEILPRVGPGATATAESVEGSAAEARNWFTVSTARSGRAYVATPGSVEVR